MQLPKVDPSKIGADATYKSPEEAEKASNGTYNDHVCDLPEGDRLPNLPRVEHPKPFR